MKKMLFILLGTLCSISFSSCEEQKCREDCPYQEQEECTRCRSCRTCPRR